jgi:MinD superfamily P-loop ATPase
MRVTRRTVKEHSDDASKLIDWTNYLKSAWEDLDFIIFDTSPGLNFSAVNAIAASDLTLLLVRLVNADLNGTKEMVINLHSKLGVPLLLVVNQMPETYFHGGEFQEAIDKLLEEELLEPLRQHDLTLSGIMPHDHSILDIEIAGILQPNRARPIHMKEAPDSQIWKTMDNIIEQIVKRYPPR